MAYGENKFKSIITWIIIIYIVIAVVYYFFLDAESAIDAAIWPIKVYEGFAGSKVE